RVAVGASVDGGMSSRTNWFRHREVRLTDAEVDWVLEPATQLEDLAHIGQRDGPRAPGNPAVGHGFPPMCRLRLCGRPLSRKRQLHHSSTLCEPLPDSAILSAMRSSTS